MPKSPPITDRLRRRHAALQATRAFFVERGFLEVDTPSLVPGPGLEPHIDPLAVDVRTTMGGPSERRWLITSPELALKRVVAAGSGPVFQLGHVFRDGERTKRHLPEFTLLEWYRPGGTLDDLVTDHEELFAAVASALSVPAPVTPFHRTTVSALFRDHGVDLSVPEAAVVDAVRARLSPGERLRDGADFEDAFFHVMDRWVEPRIGRDRPCVVSRWPAQMAVLARHCDDDVRFAERFEIYAGGLELSNAFDELCDPVEQRARFHDDNRRRLALEKEALPLDEDFLRALSDLPPTAGCALGFDRLLMLLLGADTIDDVTVLPWR